MNDVTMNLPEVRETGTELYPNLADIYNTAWNAMHNVSETIKIAKQSSLEASLRNYTAKVSFYLEVSEFRLNSCGDTLVKIVDDLGEVDKESASRIENPVEGIVGKDEKREP